MPTPTPDNPYKAQEFEAFLKTLRVGTKEHWVKIAETLGVSQETIGAWKKHPLAQEAIREGIQYALQQMQKAGKKDWKMWEAKLKYLDMHIIERVDVTSGGQKIQPILGGISDGIHTDDGDTKAGDTP